MAEATRRGGGLLVLALVLFGTVGFPALLIVRALRSADEATRRSHARERRFDPAPNALPAPAPAPISTPAEPAR